jgi:hypothetical protein
MDPPRLPTGPPSRLTAGCLVPTPARPGPAGQSRSRDDALPDRAGRASNHAVLLEWFRGPGPAGPDRHGSVFSFRVAAATHTGAAP